MNKAKFNHIINTLQDGHTVLVYGREFNNVNDFYIEFKDEIENEPTPELTCPAIPEFDFENWLEK